LKKLFLLLAGLVVASCAAAPQGKSAAASTAPAAAAATPASVAAPACTPPPTELQVKDLEPGTGRAIRFRSAALVTYTGWLYDGCKPDHKGAEFDSNRDKPTPFGFMVGAGRVIKGWDEGMIGLKEKGKRLLVIPPDKGYGAQAAPGGKIPPNSTLVFEVYLAEIVYQPGEPQAQPPAAPR
jgi:FKBP-type peptidyl-prolyl cis-trans isomerase